MTILSNQNHQRSTLQQHKVEILLTDQATHIEIIIQHPCLSKV